MELRNTLSVYPFPLSVLPSDVTPWCGGAQESEKVAVSSLSLATSITADERYITNLAAKRVFNYHMHN